MGVDRERLVRHQHLAGVDEGPAGCSATATRSFWSVPSGALPAE
jgi:hypothetical protein